MSDSDKTGGISEKRWYKPGRATRGRGLPIRYPKRDKLIQSGKTLSAIMNACRLSGNGASDYIIRTGQYRIWKERLYRQRIRLTKRGVPLAVIARKENLASEDSVLAWLRDNGLSEIRKHSNMYYRRSKKGKREKQEEKRNPIADYLITSGLSQEAIARICAKICKEENCGRAWTHNYYKRTGQLDLYHKSKPGYLNYVASLIGAVGSGIVHQLSGPVVNIANIIQNVQIQAYKNASDDERRAFDYLQFVIESDHNWAGPLHRYFTAKKLGETPSLEKLCSGLNCSPIGFCRILKALHLKPLGRTGFEQLKERREDQTLCGEKLTEEQLLLFGAIIDIIIKGAYCRARAEIKVYEFLKAFPSSYSHNPKSVLRVIAMYLYAKENGEKVSISKLSKRGGVYERKVAKIFKFFGWHSMYKTPKKLTSEQEAMIYRAYPLEMSVLDIAYFAPTDLTYRCIRRNIGKRPVKNSWAECLGLAGTNRFASQVYELDDLVTSDGVKGFSRQEIAEGLGVNLKRVDYALENRAVIEPKIIYALRVLYQDQGINTPYLIKR